MEGWSFSSEELHFKLGYTTLFFALCVIIGGIVANSMHKFAEMAWQSARLLFMKTVHGLFGFGLVLFAQITVMTGILCYYDDNMDMPVGWTLAIINFVGFFTVLIVLECLHWR